MELKHLDEVRHAVAALASGNGEALDRLVWTAVFGAPGPREAARAAILDQARSAGIYPASIHDLYLAAETDLGAVLTHIEQLRPDLLVVDSVQTISADGVDGVPGGVSQVKEVTAALVRQAKTRGMATVLAKLPYNQRGAGGVGTCATPIGVATCATPIIEGAGTCATPIDRDQGADR